MNFFSPPILLAHYTYEAWISSLYFQDYVLCITSSVSKTTSLDLNVIECDKIQDFEMMILIWYLSFSGSSHQSIQTKHHHLPWVFTFFKCTNVISYNLAKTMYARLNLTLIASMMRHDTRGNDIMTSIILLFLTWTRLGLFFEPHLPLIQWQRFSRRKNDHNTKQCGLALWRCNQKAITYKIQHLNL